MLVAYRKLDLHSRFPFHQHQRQGARGRPRPEDTRLETRTSIRRSLLAVDFIECSASQGGMRPILIVPDGKPGQFLPERLGT